MAIYEPTLEALNRATVRYVIVGGLAVVLHGYARLTADLDLAVDLSPEQARKAIDALRSLGLQPTLPVDPAQFADPLVRSRWSSEKHMKVFSMADPDNPLRQVDLFVDNPIEFDELWRRSELVPLGSTEARIASIADMIHLKRIAGRRQDLIDIEPWRLSRERGSAMPDQHPAAEEGLGSYGREDGWGDPFSRHLTLWLRATPSQRLAWLEEAIGLARRAGALPRRTPPPT